MSWFSQLDPAVKVIGGLITAAGAFVALLVAWNGYNACSVAGMTFDQITNQPIANVRVGYDPNNVGYFREGYRPSMVTLAISSIDGSFKGDCRGAHDQAGDASFELLYVGGEMLPGLPCLETKYTAIRIENRGEHSGINVPVVGC
jgi:hypothetical protein